MLPAKHNMDVIVIDDLWAELGMNRPAISLQLLPNRPLRLSRPWQFSLAAVVLTILLHVLLGLGMFSTFGDVKASQHNVDTIGHIADPSTNTEAVSVLILISNESNKAATDINQRVAAQAMVEETESPEPEIETPSMEQPHSEDVSVIATDTTTPTPQPRTLEDIYMGQIKARVERAWSDSQGVRMAVGNCKVNIQQGKQGEVTKVGFGRCFATPAWKETLAQAIRYASPLPAPPDEKVFSAEVSLEF